MGADILKIMEQFNNLELSGIEGVRVGYMLRRDIELHGRLDILRRIKMALMSSVTIFNSLRMQFEYEDHGTPKTLFCYWTQRADHRENLLKVANLVENRFVAVESGKRKLVLSRMKHLNLPFKWYFQFKKYEKSPLARCSYSAYLFEAYMSYIIVEKEISARGYGIESVVTLHNSNPLVSLYQQLYKIDHKSAIGVIDGYISSSFKFILEEGQSEKLLCCGQFDKDMTESYEMDSSIMIPVGACSAINRNDMEPETYHNTKYTLFVNSDEGSERSIFENEIRILDKFCRKHHVTFDVKLHPINCLPENYGYYKKIVSNTCAENLYGTEVMAADILRQTDIAIINRSSVLLEAFSCWTPVFRFKGSNGMADVGSDFDRVDMFSFGSVEELEALHAQVKKASFSKRMRDIRNYLIAPGKVEDNFKRVFHELGVD